jgi:hypothetical protein
MHDDDADAGAGAPDGAAPMAPRGDTVGVTSSARLVSFERATGAIERALAISGLAHAERILGADIRPASGKLYALTNQARLYTIEPTTGAAALEASLNADPADTTAPFTALSGSKFGVDWNPVADRLRVVSDQGQNLRIQPLTGATTTDAAINPASALSAAAYTNSFASACRTQLLVIDGPARTLSLQDPPNNGSLTLIGSLGDARFEDVSAFEIQTSTGGVDQAFIAVVTADGTQVLDLNLSSGIASNPRDLKLDFGETLVGVSAAPPTDAPPQSPGELLGLSVNNRIVSFNRAAPGKLCSSAAIHGLASAEQVLGIDVRPADGALYALGSSAKLYTLDVVSGAASVKTTLVADLLDTTESFAALSGVEFGLAFNPVSDRLRVMSDTGQNLRINVTNGATITDAALSGAVKGLSAAAYTNAFAGAKSTTLYALDTRADALVRVGADPATGGACGPDADVGNPNCGVVSALGTLGIGDALDVNGFDIDAKSGAALAALSVGMASTTLFSLDLTRGSATLPIGVANGTIGGGELLRGLTLAANPALGAFK